MEKEIGEGEWRNLGISCAAESRNLVEKKEEER